jgi:hypothetical protein
MSDGEYMGLLCPKQLAKAAAEGCRLIESSQRLRRLNEEARWQANVVAARSHALRRAAQRINEACLEAAEAIVLRDAERLALLHEAATELMANLQRAHSTAPRVDR